MATKTAHEKSFAELLERQQKIEEELAQLHARTQKLSREHGLLEALQELHGRLDDLIKAVPQLDADNEESIEAFTDAVEEAVTFALDAAADLRLVHRGRGATRPKSDASRKPRLASPIMKLLRSAESPLGDDEILGSPSMQAYMAKRSIPKGAVTTALREMAREGKLVAADGKFSLAGG